MLPKVCAWITVITFTKIYWILPMHSNVTIKNISWPQFSWATLYVVASVLWQQLFCLINVMINIILYCWSVPLVCHTCVKTSTYCKSFHIDITNLPDSNRHCLQSSSSLQLVIRRTRLSTIGDRAFPVSGTVCHLTSLQLLCWLSLGTASKLLFSQSLPS